MKDKPKCSKMAGLGALTPIILFAVLFVLIIVLALLSPADPDPTEIINMII